MASVPVPVIIPATIKLPVISRRAKLIVIGATLGLTFVGFLARYLRRRRRRRYLGEKKGTQATWKIHGPASVQNQNGDVRRSVSPGTQRYYHRPGSVTLSDRHSVTSTMVSSMSKMTPQQFGVMGMEALETGINYWEDALQNMIPSQESQLALTDAEKSSYNHLLEKILDKAYALQRDCEALFLHHNSILFRDDASIASTVDRFLDLERRTMTSMSSMDSFVSAQAEIADLREFDEFGDFNLENLHLYQLALKQLEEGGIPYRSLRAEVVGCQSDIEYLAKLHCIRLAFQLLFKDERVKNFFTDSGRQLIGDMLTKADKDPKDLLIAFDDLMEFVQEADNWPKIEEELRGRGVKCMTFYDIVLDFLILDAFEDLDSPQSSVTAVVQNRWLSNGFKEIALSTAVWSIIKTKRRLLKFSDGFISHFYAMAEHLSPVFAWGFFGPESELKDICHFFKDQVLGFLNDIYSFHKARYTCVEDFSQDILTLAKARMKMQVGKTSSG